jgi:hypothetical protein
MYRYALSHPFLSFTPSLTNSRTKGSKIVGANNSGNSNQGVAVAISANGNVIASGGWYDNNYAGATWIFTRNTTRSTLTHSKKLDETEPEGADRCSPSLLPSLFHIPILLMTHNPTHVMTVNFNHSFSHF